MRVEIAKASLGAVLVVLAFRPNVAAQDAKASEVLAGARKAIGGKKLDSMTSLSVQGAAQRNVGNFQMASEFELLLGLPDKYIRSETSNSPMLSLSNTTGFNGDRPIKPRAPGGLAPGGGMVIRMGGPGVGMPGSEKPTPEQQEQIDKQLVRSAKYEIGRLMLGWFATAHPSLSPQYTFSGEASSPDGKAFVVEVKTSDGFSARLFIDEATHLPLMLTYQGPQTRTVTVGGPVPGGRDGRSPQTQARASTPEERQRAEADAQRQIEQMQSQPPALVEYTLYFDDWRDEDGIKFPHSFRRASAGTTVEEWTISKIKLNPKIDPKKFDTEQ